MRRLRPALLAALLSVPLSPALGAGAERVVDYLYLDANEGGAAGGHTAVRLGDDVFHFEYRRPGLLVLSRAPFEEFRRQYGDVENRTIEVSRIPVSDTAYARLLQRLTRRHLVQRQHLEALETLRADRRILEEIRSGRVRVEGAGFFADGGDAGDERAREPALVALRRRVTDTYGANFLAEGREALRRRLAELAPTPGSPAAPVASDEMPPLAYEFPQRYRDALTTLAAFTILEAAPPLAPDATLTGSGDEFRLRDGDAALVSRMSDALAGSLVRLLDSRRPDRGFPLLLGMARLAALERTRASGAWVFLDTARPDTRLLAAARVRERAETMLGSARADFETARARLVARGDGAAFAETEFADLEDAGNRMAEIAAARDGGRDLRLDRAVLPARVAARAATLAPAPEILAAAVASVMERIAAQGRTIERDYRYHLATRNCVSELLREMDAALRADDRPVAWPLDFIPAASAAALPERYPVTEVVRIPSRRQAALARLYEEAHHPVAVFLREGNTLTSTLYRRRDDDSVFLLFTDDVVVARPLFGAVNLLTGVAATVAGVATLPFDDGRLLRAGARGALFSLPELFFQNIRKGSVP